MKFKDPAKWYSSLKRLASYEVHKREDLIVSDINHLSEKEQVELIADSFAKIQNEYQPINQKQIKLPKYSELDVPCFSINEVWLEIIKLNPKKACIKGDIPSKVLKIIAAYIAEPFAHIVNCAIGRGEYPNIFKHKIITPVPKSFPCSNVDQLRNISGLLQLDKVREQFI